MNKPVLRILDANYNRAKEAMRVAEDIIRFVARDSGLTAQWKRCRHDLTGIVQRLPLSYRQLIHARESSTDIGRRSFIDDKRGKNRWHDLLIANAKRGQEALRVLEELAKIFDPRQSSKFQRLRFRLYELEKKSLRKL
ncbi:MAG TPA: thiamine-phosphate pyrophosphorylase [bacterium]|nr:thiamine-phosphate pyrophosphorylase [bacterium]